MKTKMCTFGLILVFFSSCTPGVLQCYLTFADYNKRFDFDFSKEELKNRIVESYSYNESLLLKNLGKTTIENEEVNSEYRKSTDIWLDKNNWDQFQSEIRSNTTDTLKIIIGKHHSRRQIELMAIVEGDDRKSSLTIDGFSYTRRRACEREQEYYKVKLADKTDEKFIDQLK